MNIKRSLRNFGKTMSGLAVAASLSCYNPFTKQFFPLINNPTYQIQDPQIFPPTEPPVTPSITPPVNPPTIPPIEPPTIPPIEPPAIETKYSVQQVQTPDTLEYRLMYDKDQNQRHFLSVINTNEGAVAIRPHPGVDENGWGSTWYPQPFFAGAVLRHTTIAPEAFTLATDGINVNLEGLVSQGQNGSTGNWELAMKFHFDTSAKKINGTGTYNISLPAPLTEDLNVYKIASNFLHRVPLLNGSPGNTGDMKQKVLFFERERDYYWIYNEWDILKNPSFFPNNKFYSLIIETEGNHNIVDTATQGHAPIEPAFKPSLKVSLKTDRNLLSFGGIYDLDHSTEFFSDNVGITPLIKVGTTDKTEFNFNANFESTALPEDVNDPGIITNRPPVAQPTEITLSFFGERFTFPIIATDENNDTLRHTIKKLPQHATLYHNGRQVNEQYEFTSDPNFSTTATSSNYLGVDSIECEVTDGMNFIDSSVNILFADKNHGGQGEVIIPQELLDHSDKFRTEIVAHSLNPSEQVRISPDGSRILFVQASQPYNYFSGSTRRIQELIRSNSETDELFGVKYITEGAGDQWGQIHETNFGFVSNEKIVVERKTYISYDLDLVNINNNNRTPLDQNENQIIDNANSIRYDPVQPRGVLNVHYHGFPGQWSWVELNTESEEITERDIFGQLNNNRGISDAIFLPNGKVYGLGWRYENYRTTNRLIEIFPQERITRDIATEDEIKQSALGELNNLEGWSIPALTKYLMYNEQDNKLIIPFYINASTVPYNRRKIHLVSYEPSTQNFSLLANNIPTTYYVPFPDSSFDLHNRTMYIANNDHILRLNFKPPQ